jgi:hypothetical protein
VPTRKWAAVGHADRPCAIAQLSALAKQDRERGAERYFCAIEKLTFPPAVPVVVTVIVTVLPRVLTRQSTC